MSGASANNRSDFQDWLEKDKSSTDVSAIMSILGVFEILLRKIKAISNRIMEIDDPEEKSALISNIKNNKGLRLYSKRCHSAVINGLILYREFLEHRNEPETEPDSEDKDDDLRIVSFTEKADYAYTCPISLKYYESNFYVRNWSDLYLQTVKCLYGDFKGKILSLVGKNIGGRGRWTDINNSESGMTEPKEVAANLYVETSYNASSIVDKIKQLMDICDIDYTNIVIEYIPRNSVGRISPVNETARQRGAAKNNPDFYIWLTESEGLAAPSGRSYSSAINNCDSYCAEHNIGTGKIHGADSSEEIGENIERLLTDADFQSYDDSQHHRLSAALAKYQRYLGLLLDAREHMPTRRVVSEESDVGEEELSRIRATLEIPRFKYGFSSYDGIELCRFRASYKEVNGSECVLEDDTLLTAIRKMGFEFDGKVYLISEDKMRALADEILAYQDQGLKIIYYEQLYDSNLDEYSAAKIVSADMLKDLLKYLLPRFRYKGNYFALSPEKHTELELVRDDIIRVWGADTLQTFDELSFKLTLIPVNKIKITLAQQSVFVWNSAETYLLADRFDADEQEIEHLTDYIEKKCEENGGASLDEIPFDNLRTANPEFSDTAIVTCFCKLVEDRFERKARILTHKDASKDTYTAIIEFCQRHDKCTYDCLEHIAQKVAGTLRQPEIIEAANAAMVRIDKDNFIADSKICFDVDKIDAALDYIVPDEFIGMREVITFSTFPFCGYGWNLFLLESYCRRFSKKYKYETRRANSSNSGAIVVKTCNMTYHDIMAHAVARSERDLNQEEAFNFLTETGYMERKRYSDIDLLINEAAGLRKRRK